MARTITATKPSSPEDWQEWNHQGDLVRKSQDFFVGDKPPEERIPDDIGYLDLTTSLKILAFTNSKIEDLQEKAWHYTGRAIWIVQEHSFWEKPEFGIDIKTGLPFATFDGWMNHGLDSTFRIKRDTGWRSLTVYRYMKDVSIEDKRKISQAVLYDIVQATKSRLKNGASEESVKEWRDRLIQDSIGKTRQQVTNIIAMNGHLDQPATSIEVPKVKWLSIPADEESELLWLELNNPTTLLGGFIYDEGGKGPQEVFLAILQEAKATWEPHAADAMKAKAQGIVQAS